MGGLTLDERVLHDAAVVQTIAAQQLEDLCMMLQLNVPSLPTDKKLRRKLSRHASTVGLTAEDMDRAVSGLSTILTEASKNDLSSADLAHSIMSLRLPTTHVDVLTQYYVEYKDQIKAAVAWNPPLGVPAYRSLDWRFDMELGTRTLHHQANPVLTLQITTTANDTAPQLVQCSYSQLHALHDSLKRALKETSTPHGSRMQRYL
ncbi:hypothetical protein H310_05762 [Aphanomyces invadans]|uniref:COMM domain-containing protein n=1 Tax=Aphanomyces invadans TaxID=157072 RepID=A0A024U7J6_9STRA|nr:hypothetical protein H310_05762 [Aphanomyces invadans]ETW02195.1 hypothetical protein H310_05762 [Aphanomyces invadans]|eukprot:XP_008868800.1 hypothetical protein H310_05762 [Aphanomyces invadans]